MQVSGIPWFQPRNNSLTGFVNLGLAGMGTMFHGESFRVFWLTGYGIMWTQGYTSTNSAPDPTTGKSTSVDTQVNTTDHGVAPGIGVDYLLTRNIGLHAAVAYTVAYKVRPADVPSMNYDAGWSLSPGGQLGAYFYY